MKKHISNSSGLPTQFLRVLLDARKRLGLSQAALGTKLGLPQSYVSQIERGRVVPRFDTALELVRTLGLDLVLVPNKLAPAVRGIIRSAEHPDEEERPLYALELEESDEE